MDGSDITKANFQSPSRVDLEQPEQGQNKEEVVCQPAQTSHRSLIRASYGSFADHM